MTLSLSPQPTPIVDYLYVGAWVKADLPPTDPMPS